MVAGIFGGELSAVANGGGLYRGGTLQHWSFSAVGIFSSQDFKNKKKDCLIVTVFFI